MKALILAGGSGTRLWPVSRTEYPKQFLKIGADKSLLQKTVLRILNHFAPADVFVLTSRLYIYAIEGTKNIRRTRWFKILKTVF